MDYKTLNLLYRFNKEFSHQRIRVKEISDTDCIMMTIIETALQNLLRLFFLKFYHTKN